MIWRIDTRRAMGRKAESVALLEVSTEDLERLSEAVQARSFEPEYDQLATDLAAAQLALTRDQLGARGGSL